MYLRFFGGWLNKKHCFSKSSRTSVGYKITSIYHLIYIHIKLFNIPYLYYFDLHDLLEMKKGILKSSAVIWLCQDLLCFKLFLDFTFHCS